MKKTLEYYQSLHYKMVVEYDYIIKLFFVTLPELPSCIAYGETIIKAINVAQRVKNDWIKTAYQKGWEIPLPESW